MTDEVGEFGAKRSVDGYPDCFLDDAGDENVCKGNALANEESARREVGLEGVEGTRLALNETNVCLDIELISLGRSILK